MTSKKTSSGWSWTFCPKCETEYDLFGGLIYDSANYKVYIIHSCPYCDYVYI